MPSHASTETYTYSSARTHQTLYEVIEAFIQMVMSLGTGLPEELLFLVRENREDWALHGLSLLFIQPPLSSSLSLCTSPIIPLRLLCQAQPASSLLLLSKPTLLPPPPPPPSPHPSILSSLCASLSKDSVNQTESRGEIFTLQEDAWASAPAVGMGWGQSHQGYWNVNTHTHTHRTSSISISSSYPCFFMYLSFRFTGWLDFIKSTIIFALTVFDREKERQRGIEREARRGTCYIIFLNPIHISKLCHNITR